MKSFIKNVANIVLKEFLQFKRDPKMFGIILIAPVVQLVLLGYAATLDVKEIKTVILDNDKSEYSRKLIEDVGSSNFFLIYDFAENYKEVTETIDKGDATFAIIIPNDFEYKIGRNEKAPIQTIFNGSDGNTASIAAGYFTKIINSFSTNIVYSLQDKNGIKISKTGNISPEVRVWYNPEISTRNFMVPGIVALLLSIITLILTSLAIVKEKEIGTLEQLIVTPIKPIELILGKIIPFIILGFIAVLIVIAAMNLIFGITVRGSLSFLLFSSFLYLLSTLGLGLFVSTISTTQQQAMMISIFGVMMPMLYLSGFAFPIENMPPIIQYISYFIPLRYFVTIIRGVVLKGIGFYELYFDTLMLFITGILILFLSAKRFRKYI